MSEENRPVVDAGMADVEWSELHDRLREIREGLAGKETVVLTNLTAAAEGMKLRVQSGGGDK